MRGSFHSWIKERREREVEIAKWIAQSKAGPQVLGVTPNSDFMLLEYFNGGTLKPNGFINKKSQFADCLRNLHSIGLPPSIKTNSTTFDRLHRQYKGLEKLYGTLPQFIQDLYLLALEYEANLPKYPKRVLCHLDLHRDNIMFHDEKMMLVDYGMTGPDHPYIDLANFAMYMCMSTSEEIELLRYYVNGEVDSDICEEYFFFRPLVYLNKITWTLTKSVKEGSTTQLIEDVWREPIVMSIKEAFNWIYTQKKRTAIDDIRYARAAYEQFYQKRKEFLEFQIPLKSNEIKKMKRNII